MARRKRQTALEIRRERSTSIAGVVELNRPIVTANGVGRDRREPKQHLATAFI